MVVSDSTSEESLKDDLSNYNPDDYKNPSVTVDIAICTILQNDLKVLLINRKFPPYRNHWAIPGGFLDLAKEESLEEAAARELLEETNINIKDVFIEQLKTYGDPKRDPRKRVITVVYYSLIPTISVSRIKAGDDAKEAQWFSLRNLPENLAFDHKIILEDLLARLIGKVSYSPIAFKLLPIRFTWKDLQNIYEIILGRNLASSNFRRMMLLSYRLRRLCSRGIIKKGRPPFLMTYKGVRETYG